MFLELIKQAAINAGKEINKTDILKPRQMKCETILNFI
jgi:hypothetical protein